MESISPNARSTVVDVSRNGALIALLWLAYRSVRSATEATPAIAIENADRLLALQARLGIAIEAELQALLDVAPLMVLANTYYLAHFPLAIVALVATYVLDRRGAFLLLRNSLLAVTSVAVTVHAIVPLAPPRMLAGFVDISLRYGPNPYALPGSDGANQFAAMPSMHVAWAVLIGAAAWQLTPNLDPGRRRVVRGAAVLHPMVTAIVVLVTAHHFVADAVIGALLAGIVLAGINTFDRRRVVEVPVSYADQANGRPR